MCISLAGAELSGRSGAEAAGDRSGDERGQLLDVGGGQIQRLGLRLRAKPRVRSEPILISNG